MKHTDSAKSKKQAGHIIIKTARISFVTAIERSRFCDMLAWQKGSYKMQYRDEQIHKAVTTVTAGESCRHLYNYTNYS